MTPEQLPSILRGLAQMANTSTTCLNLREAARTIESQAAEIERLRAELNYAAEELSAMLGRVPDSHIPHRMGELRDRLTQAIAPAANQPAPH